MPSPNTPKHTAAAPLPIIDSYPRLAETARARYCALVSRDPTDRAAARPSAGMGGNFWSFAARYAAR